MVNFESDANEAQHIAQQMMQLQRLAQQAGPNTPQESLYAQQYQNLRMRLQQLRSQFKPNLKSKTDNGNTTATALNLGNSPIQASAGVPIAQQQISSLSSTNQQSTQQSNQLYTQQQQKRLSVIWQAIQEWTKMLQTIKKELVAKDLKGPEREKLLQDEKELRTKLLHYREIMQNLMKQYQAATGGSLKNTFPINASPALSTPMPKYGMASTSAQSPVKGNIPNTLNQQSNRLMNIQSSVSKSSVQNQPILADFQRRGGLRGKNAFARQDSSQNITRQDSQNNEGFEAELSQPYSTSPARPTLTGGYAVGNTLMSSPTIQKLPAHDISGENRLLSKRKLQTLVRQIDPTETLDTEAEELLLEIADEFVESVTYFACRLAKHRKSNVLDVKDVQLHLKRNWNIQIPAFGSEDVKPIRRIVPTSSYNSKLAAINNARFYNTE